MADPVYKAKKSDDISTLAKQLKQPESKAILDEMTTLSESPEYSRSAPPETKQELQGAIQQAREMYNQRTTQNDWAEVAQTLSRAVAQFGAAQSGIKSGRDMSSINMGPTIDYGARSERAGRDYTQQVKEAGDTADRTRQGYMDSESSKEAGYKRANEPLRDRLKNAQEIEGDEARFRRQQELDAQRDKKETSRLDNTNKTLEYRDLDREESALSKRIQEQETAANTAANRIVNEGVSSKDAKKNAAQYGDLLAKAGIDPEVLADIEESSKDKGVLGTGLFRGEDKAVKAQLIKEKAKTVADALKAQLESIRARKKELLAGGQQAQPAVQSNTAPETVRIQAPDGTIAEVPKDKAAKYVQKGGKIVP